ncbi:hypothetical protein [Bacteroides thetaiotaomicron]|uniref:hypothetical protein n=1 Tax=Bacteroides thetaiotaomicron TaxID=818 RepID=UPI002005D9A4|nr:hypothetical protein [Bacteroides thetaiotaomicron]
MFPRIVVNKLKNNYNKLINENSFLLVVLSVTSALQSQVVIKENAIQSKYAFPLVTSKAKAVVVYDTDDYLVVRKTAELFVSDVESVTGQQLRLTDKLKGDKEIILWVQLRKIG